MRKLSLKELNRISIGEFKNADKTPIILILDNVRSQHNIGSAFRTADAFLLDSIYLCGISATPPNNEIHKTALGAENSVNWKYFNTTSDAVAYARKNQFKIISIEQVENSTSLTSFIPEKDSKYAIIFGNEVKGIEQEIINQSDYCIEIPQFGTKHSFNVSVSIGIVLWDILIKLDF